MTNDYKLVIYKYETKIINPYNRPKSQTRTEKRSYGEKREIKLRLEGEKEIPIGKQSMLKL